MGVATISSHQRLLLGRCNRVWRRENSIQLLQRPSLSLNGEEVPDDSLKGIPADEDENVFPSDVFKCDANVVLAQYKMRYGEMGKCDSRCAEKVDE